MNTPTPEGRYGVGVIDNINCCLSSTNKPKTGFHFEILKRINDNEYKCRWFTSGPDLVRRKYIIWGTDENRNYKFISRGWSSQLPTVLLPCECILKITSDLKCVIKLGNTLVQKEIFDDEGNLTSIQESLNNNDKNMYLGMTDSAKLYYKTY